MVSLYPSVSDSVALVELDLNMPGMGEWKCLQALSNINPRVRALIASGYPGWKQAAVESPEVPEFIAKPFTLTELSNKVREILDRQTL